MLTVNELWLVSVRYDDEFVTAEDVGRLPVNTQLEEAKRVARGKLREVEANHPTERIRILAVPDAVIPLFQRCVQGEADGVVGEALIDAWEKGLAVEVITDVDEAATPGVAAMIAAAIDLITALSEKLACNCPECDGATLAYCPPPVQAEA